MKADRGITDIWTVLHVETDLLKSMKYKSADDTEELSLAVSELSQILQVRAYAKYCYSINDPIIDFLLVTIEDFSKFKEQHLLFRPSAAPLTPTANLSATTNPSYQPEALLKKGIKRDATLFNTQK